MRKKEQRIEDDEDVVKRLYAPCLGSHTSKDEAAHGQRPAGGKPLGP